MNRRRLKISLLTGLLLSSAALCSCKTSQNKESIHDVKITKQTGNKKEGEIVLKNWNEAAYRVQNVQHREQVQSLSDQFPGIVFYKGNSHVKRVALTFDDGPDNYYTPRILNILRAKGVPGTFFMVGRQVESFPNIARQIVAEGNAIGNHSYHHPKLWQLSTDQVRQEILSTAKEIQNVTGRRTDLFRPPYGKVTPAEVDQIHTLGYRIIDWSVDTLDWKGTSASTILQFVKKEISPGAIILEHCAAGHPGELNGTLQALPQIIDYYKGQGYEFVTIPTLLAQ